MLFKKTILIFLFSFFTAGFLFSQSDEMEPLPAPSAELESAEAETAIPEPEEKPESELPEVEAELTEAQKLEQQLVLEEEKLQARLDITDKRYRTYKGLAIAGYSLAGIGTGLIIIDSISATPGENPNEFGEDPDDYKFGEMTWSGIPILISGAVMAIAFELLEKEENEKRVIEESELYDLKSELDLLRLQLYGGETDPISGE